MPPRSFAAPPPSPPALPAPEGASPNSASPNSASLAKAELRKVARALRRRLMAAHPTAAVAAAAHFPLHRLPTRLCVAALYHPIGSELDPAPLAARLRTAGAVIASPVVTGKDAALVFRLSTEQPLVPDLLGISVPPPGAPEVLPEVVILPLLAFDRTGARLGQGGGYYDRTLARLRAEEKVLAIGLAYAGQEVPRVPVDALDQRLDGVLTETAYLDFRA